MIEVGKMYVFTGSSSIASVSRGTYCLVVKRHGLLTHMWRVLMEEQLWWVHEEELRLP